MLLIIQAKAKEKVRVFTIRTYVVLQGLDKKKSRHLTPIDGYVHLKNIFTEDEKNYYLVSLPK